MPVFSRLAVAVQLLSIIITPALGAAAAATQQYDYVIVGGGITGLIVANRLSEDKTSEQLTRTFNIRISADNRTQKPYSSLRVATMSTGTRPRSLTRQMI